MNDVVVVVAIVVVVIFFIVDIIFFVIVVILTGSEDAVGSCKYPLRPKDGSTACVLIAAQVCPPLVAYLSWDDDGERCYFSLKQRNSFIVFSFFVVEGANPKLPSLLQRPFLPHLPRIGASDSFNAANDPLSNSTGQRLLPESFSTRCRRTQSSHRQKNKGGKSA